MKEHRFALQYEEAQYKDGVDAEAKEILCQAIAQFLYENAGMRIISPETTGDPFCANQYFMRIRYIPLDYKKETADGTLLMITDSFVRTEEA